MRKPLPLAPCHTTVFINARLVDPATGRDEPGGLLVKDGQIADLGGHLRRNAPEGAQVVDCKGHVLSPGLIDMQVFTGEPGTEHRESLRTAGEAAAAGGVTTIVVMPDTDPVIDEVALVDFIQRRGRDNCVVNVRTFAALTKGLEGREMTEIGLLKRTGAVGFSNGKSSVADTKVMRNALLYSKDFGALIVHYTEDPYLAAGGAMSSGATSARLGLPAEQASRLALATAAGAAALAAVAPVSPGTLAEQVASPGGSTRKGLDVLDDDQALVELLVATLRASEARNREMAAAARG